MAVVTIMKPHDCVCDNEDDTVVTTWASMYCCTNTYVYTTGLNVDIQLKGWISTDRQIMDF